MATQQKLWKTKRVQEWTERDVSDWILSLPASLAMLQPKFVAINGNQLLLIKLESKIDNKMQRKLFKQKLTSIKTNNENIVSSTPKPMTIMGLRNQGNTCYLNSAIQALLQTPQLTHYFRHSKIGGRCTMVSEWSRLCKYAMSHNHSSYTPTKIYNMVVNSHTSYRFGAQDDSYFAATAILSMMDDELASANDVSSPAKYMMTKSSLVPQPNENIIREFEAKQNPKQANIIRTLMDGIKATKRTCLQCGYFKTTYESQRTLSVPLRSNVLKLKILILINDCKLQYTIDNILEYATVSVLQYYIQQYLHDKLQTKNISIQNIIIGHFMKPRHISKNINQFVKFFQPHEQCASLNSTAFAVCKVNVGVKILIVSIVGGKMYFHLENINAQQKGFEISGDKIYDKLLEFEVDLIETIETKSLQSVCFYQDKVVKKDTLYRFDSCLEVLINVWLPQNKLNNKIENGSICKLTGLSGDKFLNGQIVKVIQFKNDKQRWQCDLLYSNPFNRYLGVKETNLKRVLQNNMPLSHFDLAQLLGSCIDVSTPKPVKLATLSQCINMMNKTEIHDSNTCLLRCEKCNKYSSLIRIETTLIKTPQILILNLERSTRDSDEKQNQYFWQKSSWNKQTHLLQFDINDLKYGSSAYDLYAVCNHHGSTSSFGHYTAFVKTIDHGKWFKTNDSHIMAISQKNIISSSALVLMYAKK